MDTFIPNELQARMFKIDNHLAFKAQLDLAKDYGLSAEYIQSYKKYRKQRYTISEAMMYACWEWDI
jgi:hypothetical protein